MIVDKVCTELYEDFQSRLHIQTRDNYMFITPLDNNSFRIIKNGTNRMVSINLKIHYSTDEKALWIGLYNGLDEFANPKKITDKIYSYNETNYSWNCIKRDGIHQHEKVNLTNKDLAVEWGSLIMEKYKETTGAWY